MHTVRNDKNCDHGMVGYPDEGDTYMLYAGEYLWCGVTPEPGYALLEMFVTDEYGNRLMADNDDLYTMPDCDVYVTAAFAPARGIRYDITDYAVGFNGNRSVMFYRQGDYEDCAAVGTGVEYFFEWDENHVLDEFSVTTESGVEVPCGKVMPYANRMEVWFTMPDEPVVVTVHVSETKDLSLDPGYGSDAAIDIAFKSDSFVPLPLCPFAAPEGKEFAGWSVAVGDGEAAMKAAGEAVEMSANVKATAVFEDIAYGDANKDGAIGAKDVVAIRQYIANFDYETGTSTVSVFAGADANGDGAISAKDVVLVRQYIANYDYETGTSSLALGPKG
jgi:hypothetical protein